MADYWRAKTPNGLLLFEVNQDGSWRSFTDKLHASWGYTGLLVAGESLADALKRIPGTEPPVHVEVGANECYHRVSRAKYWPVAATTLYASAWRESVRVTQNLARRLRTIFDTVEPVPAHDAVYGHELRMLLLLACNEVEASCKAVLRAHGASAGGMNDYRRLAPIMRLGEWQVRLVTNPNYGTITPFEAWAADSVKGSLDWYQAHHSVKHDREQNFHFATLGNTIKAVGAAFVLRLAQFGLSFGELFAATAGGEEFEVVREPSWLDSERYVAPVVPNGVSPLFGTTVNMIKHPAL